MSVLKAKLNSKPAGPKKVPEIGVWSELQSSLLDTLSALTGQDLEAGTIKPETERLKVLRGQFPAPRVMYTIKCALSPTPIILIAGHKLCAQISAFAVGSQRGAAPFEGKVRYLDVMLCEPLSVLTAQFLNLRTGGAPPPSFEMAGRALNFDRFELGSENARWLRIDLSFTPGVSTGEAKLEEPETGQETGQEEKSAAAKHSDDSALTLSLLWPESLFSQMEFLPANSSAGRAKTRDDNDPWAEHMIKSAASARIRIRAVLDNYPMSVAECTRLQIGQILPLDGASTRSVRVEAESEKGPRMLSRAVLGAYKSRRALRLKSDMGAAALD